MQTPNIFNIQKFSTHDGPGIRTTVFFKGCPIRCLWCHNPESQRYEAEVLIDEDGKKEDAGQKYKLQDLVKILLQDQLFYDQSGGGVTLSGGEVMTQNMDYILPLVQSLHRRGVSIAIDTCGVAAKENFRRILPFVDLFLYDLKFIDSDLHRRYTSVSNEPVLENLRFLSDNGARINLRMILLDGLNVDPATIQRTIVWLRSKAIRLEKISLLPYHDFGRNKYAKLGRECTQNFLVPLDATVVRVKQQLEEAGYTVSIGA